MNVGIAKPFIGEEEKQEVMAVLESGQLVQGAWVSRFEEAFCKLQGVKHAVAVSNGTTALTASLMASGIGPGDEVIVPSFSFFATASSVLSVHATPVFVDVDPLTYTMSADAAEAAITAKTRAIMPVHLYGQAADMNGLSSLCTKKGLILLEDAAQAHLATFDGRPVGTYGTASFSFYPSKNAMCGEGGIISTERDEIATVLRMIRNQGMSTQYLHEVVGYNYRMTNLCAAIGIPQLGRLEAWTQKRIENASYFDQHLRNVTTPHVRAGSRHVYHQYTVQVAPGTNRDEFVAELNKRGVGARVYYPLPIHKQPIIEKLGFGKYSLPVTEQLAKAVLSLPVHPFVTEAEREFIVKEVNALC